MRPESTSTTTVRLKVEPVTIFSVHDGDTFRVSIPMSYMIPGAAEWIEDVRLAHVNAAELSTDEGKKAADAVRDLLMPIPGGPSPSTLLVYGRDKYGRLLADLQTPAGNGILLSEFVLSLKGTNPMSVSYQLDR